MGLMLARKNGSKEEEKSGQGIEQFVEDIAAGCASKVITPENVNKLFDRPSFATYAFIVIGSAVDGGYATYFGQFSRHAVFEEALRAKGLLRNSVVRGQIWLEEDGHISELQLFDDDNNQFFSEITSEGLVILVKQMLENISPIILSTKISISLNGRLCFFYFKGNGWLKQIPDKRMGTKRKN